jgi:hypothetical protein
LLFLISSSGQPDKNRTNWEGEEMLKKTLLLLFLILLGLGAIFISCGDDCPTCPKEPQPPPLGHYRIYGFDGIQGLLMSIDTPADTIVDSIRVEYSGGFIFVTPDGKKLLVMYDYNSTKKVEIYNTSDLSHVGSLDQYGFYYFDGGDNYGVYVRTGGNINFIDPETFLIEDTIYAPSLCGYLDTVADLFFGAAYQGATIYEIDCKTRTLVDSFTNLYGGNVKSVAYNRLTNDLYYFTILGSTYSLFVQYDCENDSVISKTVITQSTGNISISPDCQNVYMTDGGNSMLDVKPPGQIWVFDAMTHQISAWIPNINVLTNRKIYPCLGQVIITPDGNRAYIGAATSSRAPVPLPVVDLNTDRIIKTVFPDSAAVMVGVIRVAMGPVPEN